MIISLAHYSNVFVDKQGGHAAKGRRIHQATEGGTESVERGNGEFETTNRMFTQFDFVSKHLLVN